MQPSYIECWAVAAHLQHQHPGRGRYKQHTMRNSNPAGISMWYVVCFLLRTTNPPPASTSYIYTPTPTPTPTRPVCLLVCAPRHTLAPLVRVIARVAHVPIAYVSPVPSPLTLPPPPVLILLAPGVADPAHLALVRCQGSLRHLHKTTGQANRQGGGEGVRALARA